MEMSNISQITKKYRSKVVEVLREADSKQMTPAEVDTALNDIVDELLNLEQKAKKALTDDPETLSSVSQRVNTAISALTQLKKKVTIYIDKHTTGPSDDEDSE